MSAVQEDDTREAVNMQSQDVGNGSEDKAEALFDRARKMMDDRAPTADIVSVLQQAIDAGSPGAAYALATWYLYGKDGIVPKDFGKAVELLQAAAETHYVDALYDLAVCYANGEAVEKSPEKAFELYLQAALHGDAKAIFKVGRSYFYGHGVAQDQRVANIWLDRAYELGTFEMEPETDSA
jgi:uncharacterized protein